MSTATAPAAPAPPAAWLDRVETVAPTVLVLGGFLTAPPLYGPLRRRLRARGAAEVLTDGIWTPEWVLAAPIGLGRLLRRAATALDQAVAASAASERSAGAPILIVGHSSGGILARLLMAETPYEGRRFARAADIGALVTLGAPHHAAVRGELGRTMVTRASRWLARAEPGAFHAPDVGYVTVASRAIVARPDGRGRERLAERTYRAFLPDLPGPIAGDGVVPVESALLEGTEQVVLDGIVHGQGGGRPWYGTDPALDRWWPVALDAWRAALRARAAGHAARPGHSG